jgi:hypothetical protein
LAANLILSARGLYQPEGVHSLGDHKGTVSASSSLSSLHVLPPPLELSELPAWQADLVNDMQNWETGLDAFYAQTFRESRFLRYSAKAVNLKEQPGMQAVAAIVIAQEPLNLQQLAHIMLLPSWQAVRDLLKPVITMFPLNNAKRQEYIDLLNPKAYQHLVANREWDPVLGHAEDRESSFACALSVPTAYHKSVFDWLYVFLFLLQKLICSIFHVKRAFLTVLLFSS